MSGIVIRSCRRPAGAQVATAHHPLQHDRLRETAATMMRMKAQASGQYQVPALPNKPPPYSPNPNTDDRMTLIFMTTLPRLASSGYFVPLNLRGVPFSIAGSEMSGSPPQVAELNERIEK